MALWLLLYIIGGVLALPLGAVLSFACYIYYQRSKYSHLPSPKLPKGLAGFIFGHAVYIKKYKRDKNNEQASIRGVYQQWYSELGCPTVMAVHLLHITFVAPCHPENIKEVVMQIKNSKPGFFKTSAEQVLGERFLGNALVLTPDYDTWKPRRIILDQPFKKSFLKTLLPSLNECTDKLLVGIRPLADGKTTVYMKQHLAEVTLNIVSKVAFGSDFTEHWNTKTLGLKWTKGNGKLTYVLAHSLKGFQLVGFNPLNKFYRYLHPLKAEGYREAVRALRMIGRDCIMKRIKAIEAGEQVPRDILSCILQMASIEEVLKIEDLVDEFVSFYVGGQETVCNTLSFGMVLIHQHPEVLCRLQAEVEEVLGERTEVTNEDLEKLQYTGQVCMEILRLYPPVGGLFKCAMEGGIKLPVGDHFVPGGAALFILPGLMGRMPQYFDNPEEFDPSRFNPENEKPSSFVYFPFGVGHRSCIGKYLAMMEVKLILARLVQTFRFTLPPDYKLVVAVILTAQPKGDVPCTVSLAQPSSMANGS